MLDPYRPTRDIDLLAYGNHDEASVRVAMHEICGISCPEDGLLFDLESLAVSQIRADQNYPGTESGLASVPSAKRESAYRRTSASGTL